MKRHPLIFAAADDPNAIVMRCALQQIGSDAVHSPHAWHPGLDPTSIEIAADTPLQAQGGLAGTQISAVWNRRRRPLQRMPGCHPDDFAFVRDEWQLLHDNVFVLQRQLSPCLWVNPPAGARDAENKLLQLQHARALGLNIPATLVSNDPAAIRRFVGKQRSVIYKSFMPHTWQDAGGRLYNVSVPLLDPDTLPDDAALRLCPGIYQAFVDKRADLRVVIVGDHLFATRIQRDDGSAFVDWRPRTYLNDCVARSCTLPQPVIDRLQTLMRALGIVYGAVDLVEDRHSNLHFLEVNQSGQFGFVEEWAPELPILGAFASMLAQGRVDYSLADAARVRLADCRTHDLYLAWAERQPAAGDTRDWVVTAEQAH